MDRNDFIKFLEDETDAHWLSSSLPLYLADIPSLLRERKSLDYKDILGEQRLKGFAEETSASAKYKVVKHPFQKAKIGLIPSSASFNFPDDRPTLYTNLWEPPKIEIQEARTYRATLDFLKVISSLTPEEQATIVIPTYVIAKLLNQK